MTTSTLRLHNGNVSFASRTSQDAVDGSTDESDGESSTKKKRGPIRGRKKTTTETSESEREEKQINSEQTTPEVKRRGRKKGKCTYWLHFCNTFISICWSFVPPIPLL